MENALLDRFYAAFQRDPRRLWVPRTKDLPRDMLTEEKLEPPWVGWKPIPWRYPEEVIKEWEERNGWRLPSDFHQFLEYRHTLQLDCGIVRLVATPSPSPFLDLEELMDWDVSMIRAKQLLPIGDEAIGKVGPLCLDVRTRGVEPPVVYYDTEGEEVSPPIFSSFAKLLECAAFAMERDLAIWEDPATLEQFLALDPAGAGGTGRKYWAPDEED